MWDCRSDNNALVCLFGIRLAGVLDLQLHCLAWSLASNPADQTLHSLHWAVANANHAGMEAAGRAAYSRVVQMARILSVPEHGGSHDVWKQRPLLGILQRYCTDAKRFFAIREHYRQIEVNHAESLRAGAQRRLEESSDPEYSSRPRNLRLAADQLLVSNLLRCGIHEADGSLA